MYTNKNLYKRKFVVFEGIDKSGKSLRARLMAEKLKEKGCDVLLTKEPTSNSVEGRRVINILKSEKSIKDPKAFQKDFTTDRIKHVQNKMIPALKQGKIVISDRYFFSTFAYGFASGVDKKFLYALNQEILVPDIMFFMHTTPGLVCRRLKAQKQTKELFEKERYLRAAFGAYQSIIQDFLAKTQIIMLRGDIKLKHIPRQVDRYIHLVEKPKRVFKT